MYLAQLSTLQTQAPFYINILENIIKDSPDIKTRIDIDSAILEAVQVAKGDKNIFSIDNNHYFFITTLLENYKENLLKIEDKNINKQTYFDIIKMFK